jgi:hypothetical protein
MPYARIASQMMVSPGMMNIIKPKRPTAMTAIKTGMNQDEFAMFSIIYLYLNNIRIKLILWSYDSRGYGNRFEKLLDFGNKQ